MLTPDTFQSPEAKGFRAGLPDWANLVMPDLQRAYCAALGLTVHYGLPASLEAGVLELLLNVRLLEIPWNCSGTSWVCFPPVSKPTSASAQSGQTAPVCRCPAASPDRMFVLASAQWTKQSLLCGRSENSNLATILQSNADRCIFHLFTTLFYTCILSPLLHYGGALMM